MNLHRLQADLPGTYKIVNGRLLFRPRSLRGLDWSFYSSQMWAYRFGPFISVYLTTQKWTQVDIALILTVGRSRGASRSDNRRNGRRCRPLGTAAIRHRPWRSIAGALWPSCNFRFSREAAGRGAAFRRELCAGTAMAAISLVLVGSRRNRRGRLGGMSRYGLHRQRSCRRRDGCVRIFSGPGERVYRP